MAHAARHFPAVVLTGPRRAGKTMLLRRLFPKAGYFLLEDPDVVARLRADPHGFLDAVKTPVILDEVQQDRAHAGRTQHLGQVSPEAAPSAAPD